MTTFWKSQSRKWCDFCKCWLSDNKPSIDFHENGKRHKEAVAMRIKESRQKGQEAQAEKAEVADMLRQIERDAVSAMQKDVEQDSSLAAHYNRRLPPPRPAASGGTANAQQFLDLAASARQRRDQHGMAVTVQAAGAAAQPASFAPALPDDIWAEMETENGHVYYYNTRTGESSWTNPADAIAEAAAEAAEAVAKETADGDGDGAKKSGGGWFNDDTEKVPPPPPPPKAGGYNGGGGSGGRNAEYALSKYDRSGAAGSTLQSVAAAAAPPPPASGAAAGSKDVPSDAGVGGWGVVATDKVQAAAAPEKASEPDAVVGADGQEAAIVFAAKATPSLKRPAGEVGAVKMKKRKGNAKARGRITKPG
eukprot:m.56853 g.56853  ORF g.56853 m.56853 type:complete len:364 (+) comp9325_c0_seq1:65-1156(+)